MTDEVDTNSYDFADYKIRQLIDQLETDQVCSWCVARALMANGMDLLVVTAGSREAIITLRGLAMSLLPDAPIPGRDASRQNQ